jgi:GTP:adenosylcobinamide-phosphate guanylyltransferase
MNEIETVINSDYANVAGIIVQKNGIKVYEKYFNGYTTDNAVHVCSVTKSVLSVLIGIAIDQGHIDSLDQKVLAFFPDYKVKDDETSPCHALILKQTREREKINEKYLYLWSWRGWWIFWSKNDPK